jgi:hypothetical protein
MNDVLEVKVLSEPKIEFGNDFICDDPKMGIAVGSFFNSSLRSINFSIIGTNNNIQDFNNWLNRLNSQIVAKGTVAKVTNDTSIIDGEVNNFNSTDEFCDLFSVYNLVESESDIVSENIINKKFNPDFLGLGFDNQFKCSFENDTTNNGKLRDTKIKEILNDKNMTSLDKLNEVVELYRASYFKMIEKQEVTTKLDICFIIIPEEVFKKVNSVNVGNQHINFRRKLKAELISHPHAIPVQIILESSLLGTKKSLQDLSMMAWNFTVANYYKAGGTPWALRVEDKNTCFIGISFHKVIGSNKLRSSVAQAFNYEGKGLIFVGKQFEWNSKELNSNSPHLSYEYAKNLIENLIETYQELNDNKKPTRVVIHKTTDFWDTTKHQEYCEVEGLEYGLKEKLGDDIEIDFVTIKSSKIKLFREVGQYPVPRGTLLKIDSATGVLYTTGYIPYYELYPGVHMPQALSIDIYKGDSTLEKVCNEILALSKMNFNNCNYYDSLPITIRFAQKVGEIIQYFPEDKVPPKKYSYYM